VCGVVHQAMRRLALAMAVVAMSQPCLTLRQASWPALTSGRLTLAVRSRRGLDHRNMRMAVYDSQIPQNDEASEPRRQKPLTKPAGQPVQAPKTDTLTIPVEAPNVGAPQVKQEREISIDTILQELQAIQNTGPQKYCILGTRHCSYLHQQLIELLSYALVLTGNHIFTSGSPGTNAAAIRGALRAERADLLTVLLPQSMSKQPQESQNLLAQVDDVIENKGNDHLTLDVASRLCNSDLLSRVDQLISFAFHDSNTVIEASREAKALDKVVTTLFLD